MSDCYNDVIPFPVTRPDLDICACGDYLRDHDTFGCLLCRGLGNGTSGVVPPCIRFVFSRHASAEEIAQVHNLESVMEADYEWGQ